MATRPVSAKTKLVHLLDGAQLDVEVGYTFVGSHVQWPAISHDGKALGVVIAMEASFFRSTLARALTLDRGLLPRRDESWDSWDQSFARR